MNKRYQGIETRKGNRKRKTKKVLKTTVKVVGGTAIACTVGTAVLLVFHHCEGGGF